MKRRRVLSMLMTAVLTFSTVLPQTVVAADEDDYVLEAVSEDEEAADEAEDEIPAEELEAVPEKELPYGLNGMPESFSLDATDLEMKAGLRVHDSLAELVKMTEGVDYEEGTVICLADSEEEALTIAEAYDSELINYAQGVAKLKLPATLTVAQALSVAQDPAYRVPVVEPNYIVRIDDQNMEESLIPDEGIEAAIAAKKSSEGSSIGWEDWVQGKNGVPALLSNPDTYIQDPASESYQWMHDMIGTWSAWSSTMGKEDITVAVIDSGVLATHPDLQGRVEQVQVNDIRPDSYVMSHGTHVAGIIGATADNGIGVAGIAPKVKILSLNIFKGEYCYTEDEVRAMNICIERNVPVANMSIGGFGYSSLMDEATQKAAAAGCSIIVAMGNENAIAKAYPAAYKATIAVAAINPAGKRSNFSNMGKWCDIAAPGTLIMSCVNPKAAMYEEEDKDIADESGYYALYDGTSMACPVVAGVAALYMSQFGVKKPEEMRKLLQNNATKTSSKQIGKIVNVGKMFSAGGAKAKAVQSEDKMSFSFTLQGADEGAYIVYTTDGTDPALVDGQIVRGQIYEGSVDLKDAEGYVIVKSLVVTAAGGVGEVEMTTLKLPGTKTEDKAAKKGKGSVSVSEVDTNGRLVNGKVQIYTVNVPSTSYDDTIITLQAPVSANWTSSKSKVAEVLTASGETTVIRALKTGSTNITCKTPDGAKTVIKLKVIVPASSLQIGGDRDCGYIAIGKSKKIDVVLGATYGKPTVKKLEWDYIVDESPEITSKLQAAKAVKISSKGKVSINKKKWAAVMGNYGLEDVSVMYVYAMTTDGTELVAYTTLGVHRAPSIFTTYDPSKDRTGIKIYEGSKLYWFNKDGEGQDGYVYIAIDSYTRRKIDVEITNSNPDLVGVIPVGIAGDASGPYIIPVKGQNVYVYAINIVPGNAEPGQTGSAKVTVKLKDGSNKKVSFTVKIK
ncbi:MAG: S8 family serine peptidase [Lachnospiraceae bacterium]|nr:S8 family serine peptidase [Lachnospiraceae bacterium]